MAKLRGLGYGLSALGDALGDYFARQKAAQEIDQRQAAEQARGAVYKGMEDKNELYKTLVTALLAKNPQTAASMTGITLNNGDIASPLASEIAKMKKPEDLTPEDISSQYTNAGGRTTLDSTNFSGGPGGSLSQTPNPGGEGILKTLLSQQAAKAGALSQAENEPDQFVEVTNPDGSKTKLPTNPKTAPPTGFQTGLGAAQTGANEATALLAGKDSPAVMAAEAKAAGMKAGAEESAQFPWQLRLAQTKADIQEQTREDIAQWEKDHPQATPQEKARASAAHTARGEIAVARQQLQLMDQQGLLGPIASRWNEMAAGKIKSEDLFRDPQQAKLAADFFSTIDLTRSIATVAHGGARGGGSPSMDKIFRNIISAGGDKSIIEGQLNALDRIMTGYEQGKVPDYEAPEDPAQTALDELRKRAKASVGIPVMKPVPAHGGGR